MTKCPIFLRCLFFAAGFLAATTTLAQEPLAWKFTEGQQLRFDVTKTIAFALPNGESKYNLRQQFELTWAVQSVDDNGNAGIEQSIGRIQLSLDDPLGELEYDSSKDEDPGGVAALAGQLFHTLCDHPLRFIMSPSGNISELTVPEEVLETMRNSSFESPLTEFISEAGIRGLLFQGVPEFSGKPVSIGDTWHGTTESLSQSHSVELSYKYEGENGESLSRITPTRKVSFADSTVDQPNIAVQDHSGEILFDAERGVLTLNQWSIKLRLGIPSGNKSAEGTLDQSFKMELIPE